MKTGHSSAVSDGSDYPTADGSAMLISVSFVLSEACGSKMAPCGCSLAVLRTSLGLGGRVLFGQQRILCTLTHHEHTRTMVRMIARMPKIISSWPLESDQLKS